jgi:hypothetical protein
MLLLTKRVSVGVVRRALASTTVAATAAPAPTTLHVAQAGHRRSAGGAGGGSAQGAERRQATGAAQRLAEQEATMISSGADPGAAATQRGQRVAVALTAAAFMLADATSVREQGVGRGASSAMRVCPGRTSIHDAQIGAPSRVTSATWSPGRTSNRGSTRLPSSQTASPGAGAG